MAHESGLLHRRPSSAIVHPQSSVQVMTGGGRHCVAAMAHGSCCQQVTHYRKYHDVLWSWPSGPCTCQHHNHDGVDGFQVGARSGHRTHTHTTCTLDTVGSAKSVLYPKHMDDENGRYLKCNAGTGWGEGSNTKCGGINCHARSSCELAPYDQ